MSEFIDAFRIDLWILFFVWWFRWWSKGTRWSVKRTLGLKLDGQRTGKWRRPIQSLLPWTRNSEWFMGYHPLLISCHLAVLPCTHGTWQVRLICNLWYSWKLVGHGHVYFTISILWLFPCQLMYSECVKTKKFVVRTCLTINSAHLFSKVIECVLMNFELML